MIKKVLVKNQIDNIKSVKDSVKDLFDEESLDQSENLLVDIAESETSFAHEIVPSSSFASPPPPTLNRMRRWLPGIPKEYPKAS